nr:hypothetical protein [uncultured Catonella sp.]
MNFKKTIAKSLVVAMALGMVPMANLQTAKAVDAGEIKFDGVTGIAKSQNAMYWGVAKEDPKNGKGSVKIGNKSYKITNIQELYDEIDVYSTLKGKAGIIVAGEKAVPDDKWQVLALPAAETTFKVQLVASTSAVKGFKPANALGGESGYLVASLGKKPVEVNLAASKASVEVKLNDSEWKAFDTFFGTADDTGVTKKLKVLGQNGSTLTFRLKGTEKTWASKESKLKVATQPKAPNVKIDITKETTTIKKGTEYQVVDTNGPAVATKWILSTDKKGLSLADLKVNGQAKDVLVRTAASGKKIASKVARITLNKSADKLTIAGDKFEATGGAIKKGNTNVALVETSLAYDITKGATLKNISKMDLEYALVKTDKADKVKWSTLKASKDPEKKPTKANLKFSKDVKANSWSAGKETKLFVRLAGTKQTKDNVVTQSGVSAGGVMALTNIEQKFKFESGSTADNANCIIEANAGATTASIKIATGTAAKVTVKASISKVVNPKGGAAKIKATTPLPKGVTIKAGKIDATTGKFDITVDINKNAFKDAVPTSESAYTLQFEGVKDSFKIKIEKK